MTTISPGAARGARRRERAQGIKAPQLQEALMAIDPALAGWADAFIFDEVWGRPRLTEDERMLVAITSLASIPNVDQLRNYLFGALQAGIPARKLHELLLMQVVYAGFPRALGPLQVWREVVAAARRNGTVIDLDDDQAVSPPPKPPMNRDQETS